ncbi:MAG: 3'(2'),5'-bisphosphate nucleotidase CysQ [Candidatus Nanopelagicales bacterium]
MTDQLTDMQISAVIAAEAGALLMDLRQTFGQPSDQEAEKELKSLGDRRSHNHIVARFGELRPHDLVLSEEGVDDSDRLAADRVWIVDPLDGTREFGQGRDDFAVHIVLWSRDASAPTGGRLSASTVELPAQKMTRRQDDIAPMLPGLPRERPVRIVASRTRPPATLGVAVDIMAASLAQHGFTAGVEVIDVGSVGAKVNEILCGRADAYVHDTGFWEWDVAAPLAIAHAYGLTASHIDGRPVEFNAPHPYVTDLIVGNPGVVSELQVAMIEASQA